MDCAGVGVIVEAFVDRSPSTSVLVETTLIKSLTDTPSARKSAYKPPTSSLPLNVPMAFQMSKPMPLLMCRTFPPANSTWTPLT